MYGSGWRGGKRVLGTSVRVPGGIARRGDAWEVSRGILTSRGFLTIATAAVVIGVALGLIWSVIGTLRGLAPGGPADILAPARGYSGALGWSQPAAYMPLAIAGVVAAVAAAGAVILRARRRAAMLVAFTGVALAIAVALPWSPLHDLLIRDSSEPRSGLAGPFLPWMIAAFFAWAVGLLFLALISDRHSWALFFYALLWSFWIPAAVANNLPSLGLQRPAIAQHGTTEDLMNSRLAERLRNAGTVPLENGGLMSLTNTGALSLVPGASASQANRPPKLPVFDVEGAGHTSYLRTGTGDVYEDGKWRSFPGVPIPVPGGTDFASSVAGLAAGGTSLAKALPAGIQPGLLTPSTGAARAYQESLNVTPPPGASALGPGIVPVSAFPRSADFDGAFDPLSGTLAATESVGEAAWKAEVPAFSEEELRTAEFADSPAYLQLPDDMPQRVKDLANDVTRLERTPYAKARAIERYLKSNYRYGFADAVSATGVNGGTSASSAPSMGAAGTGAAGTTSGGSATGGGGPGAGASGPASGPASGDPVDRFLFEQRTGTCGNFSSAFVVLARAAGIPSRVVSGWSISPTAETQTVRADQAHQWAEVAFSPLGWVPFEPTPADGTPGRTAESGGTPPVARETAANAPARVSQAPVISPAAQPPAAQPTRVASSPTGGSGQTPSRTPLAMPAPSEVGGTKPPAGSLGGGAGGAGSPGPKPGPTPEKTGTPKPPVGTAEATPAASESPAALIETTTEILTIDPPRLRAGDIGTVGGTVASATGERVTGPRVEVFINKEKAQGGLPIGDGIVEDGRFAVEVRLPADLPVGKYQVIAHSMVDIVYDESWSDPEVEVFAGTLIRWRGPVDVVVGEPTTFAGTLTTDAGVPIPSAAVAVSAEGRTQQLTTAADGAFSARITIRGTGRHDVTARFAGSDLNLPQDATLLVTARRQVDLDAHWAATARPGDEIKVTGSLTSRGGGTPEPSQTIEISVRGTQISEKVVTDSSGAFSWSHRFDDPGRRRITVSHPRTDTLEAATFTGEFALEDAAAGPSGTLLIAGIAAALAAGFGAGAGAVVLARRRSRPDHLSTPEEARSDSQTVAPASAPSSGTANPAQPLGYSLRFELPQIAPDLPPVWGVGDPLELRARVTTPAGEAASGIAVRFQAGSADAEMEVTDQRGAAMVLRTFSEVASVEIGCRLDEPGSTPPAPSIQLRIVDYRQEIVRLFNDFMGRHRTGARLGPGVTPRDAEAVLVENALVADQNALDVLVSAFEEADYSEHPISRVQFERAWRAWRGLTITPPASSAPLMPSGPSTQSNATSTSAQAAYAQAKSTAGLVPRTNRGTNRPAI